MPSFRQAIDWMVQNDDTSWVHDDEPMISVTAALVADLFSKTDDQVIKAIRARLEKEKR